MKINAQYRSGKGFSLVIALLFTGVVVGALLVLIQNQKGDNLSKKAEISAWEGAEIARAARVYVRNELSNVTPAMIAGVGALNAQHYMAIIAATGPNITITQLVTENLLPMNFIRTDGGGNPVNALGQRIRIIMQNYPIGGVVTDPNTVPTAYVYFEQNPNIADVSEIKLSQDVVAKLRREGISVSAPVFNGGTNISGVCNGGGAGVVLWDTGCLNGAEFAVLTGGVFQPGSLVIPAWRSVSFDSRAVMRFPQPEQIGTNLMLTDLVMGDLNGCTADVTIPNPALGVISAAPGELCSALSDDPVSLTDNRRSILSPGNIQTNTFIIDPQVGDDVETYGRITALPMARAKDPTMIVTGQLITNGGDVANFGNNTSFSTTNIDRNLTLASGTTANITNVASNDADINDLTVDALTTGGSSSIGTLDVTGNSTIGNNLVVNNMVSQNQANVTVNNKLNANSITSGVVSVSGNNQVQSNGSPTPYSFVTNLLNAPNLTINNWATANKADISTLNSSYFDVTNSAHTALCQGDCPPRRDHAFCLQFSANGYTSYAQCMANR